MFCWTRFCGECNSPGSLSSYVKPRALWISNIGTPDLEYGIRPGPRILRHVWTNHKCVMAPGPLISARSALSPGSTTNASSLSPVWSQLETRALRAYWRRVKPESKSRPRTGAADILRRVANVSSFGADKQQTFPVLVSLR